MSQSQFINNRSSNNTMENESSQYTKRCAVYQGILAGLDNGQITNLLKISRNIVSSVRKKFNNFQGTSTKERETACCGRKIKVPHRSVRSPEFLDDLKSQIDAEPTRSMRSLAKERGCSEKTVRNAVHKDFKYKSYKFRPRHFLTPTHEEKRLQRSAIIREKIESYPLIFFSDEKKFVAAQLYNHQNDRFLTDRPQDVPAVFRELQPQSVMMLGVVSNEGDFMPPVFYPKKDPGQSRRGMSAKDYIKVLRVNVIPWMNTVANGRPYLFQQDSATCHSAKLTQKFLSEKLPNNASFITKEEWPSRSPDLNPLDYHVWAEMVRTTNYRRYETEGELKDAIIHAVANFNKDGLKKACQRFDDKLAQCIAMGGKHVT